MFMWRFVWQDSWKGTWAEPYVLAAKVVTVGAIMLSIPTALFVGIEVFYSTSWGGVLADAQKGAGG